MLHIIGIMILGFILGYLMRNSKVTRTTEKTISLTIVSMLFILGLSVGSNDAIMTHLTDYGTEAMVLALSGMAGSIVLSALVYRMFFRKGGGR